MRRRSDLIKRLVVRGLPPQRGVGEPLRLPGKRGRKRGALSEEERRAATLAVWRRLGLGAAQTQRERPDTREKNHGAGDAATAS